MERNKEEGIVNNFKLKIRMLNNSFILDPPLADARAFLYSQLHMEVEIICGLRRVEA